MKKNILILFAAGILVLAGLSLIVFKRTPSVTADYLQETQIAEQVEYILAQMTQTAARPTITATTTEVPKLTATPMVNLTPESVFLTDCAIPDPRMRPQYEFYDFGNYACKNVSYSSDGQYIVYVILVYEKKEFVKVERMGRTIGEWQPPNCSPLCEILDVVWAPDNKLAVSYKYFDTTNDKYISLLDVNGNLLTTTTLSGELGGWNSENTAFYMIEGSLAYPSFSVYDITNGRSFILDIDYGTVTTEGWSGNKIHLTVQPYTYQEGTPDPYCSLASYAAVVELTPSGPEFSIIGKSSDGTSNFFVDGNGVITKKPYKMECIEFSGYG